MEGIRSSFVGDGRSRSEIIGLLLINDDVFMCSIFIIEAYVCMCVRVYDDDDNV